MTRLSFRQRLLMGVTLFSMFFGAGNLIFPPFTGYRAGSEAVPAFLGLISTAVLFPVLGIIATARAGGMDGLCRKVHPQFSKWFTLVIYLCIGPLLAIPRTASMAFSMMSFATAPAQSISLGPISAQQILAVVFSVVFFAASRFFAQRPSHLKDILGKILTPILLLLVLVLFSAGMVLLPAETGAPQPPYAGAPFAAGFVEGYNTMDALAAMVFGILISVNIQDFGLQEEKQLRRETGISGLLVGGVLILVYGMLAVLGARASAVLPEASDGSVVLSGLCSLFFGNVGAVLLAAIFLFACFNVCTGQGISAPVVYGVAECVHCFGMRDFRVRAGLHSSNFCADPNTDLSRRAHDYCFKSVPLCLFGKALGSPHRSHCRFCLQRDFHALIASL